MPSTLERDETVALEGRAGRSATNAPQFDYRLAFSRNIGWVTPAEQERLRERCVAIAGLGGVGGAYLLTLTRLGVGRFHIADFDVFELANFNRQAGATLPHIGQPKIDVLAEMALEINPNLQITRFPRGIEDGNLDDFLAGCDVYIDGLDYFALAPRRAVFAACHQKSIPTVTAAPLGMGTAVLNFLPGKMSFEEYFQLEGYPEEEQLVRFLLGLSPAMLQRGYLVHPAAVDLAAHRGPSTPMACDICAGVAATQALKILLGRGRVLAAPWGFQLDPYRNKFVTTWRPGGNKNPIQRIGLAVAKRQLARIRRDAAMSLPPIAYPRAVEAILELSRWAPSGDNTQPWRFEIRGEDHVIVHGRDTREHCVYDLRGHASQVALGALLETMRIAASQHGLRTDVVRAMENPDTEPTFDVRLVADATIEADPRISSIRARATQRRPMSTTPLNGDQIATLEASVAPGFDVIWFRSAKERATVARLTFINAKLRLTMPEAFEVHRSVIEWDSMYSDDRIPDQAVGLDPMTLRLMRWAFKDWRRVQALNTYAGGTIMPRLLLDLVPGIGCAAHSVLVAKERPKSVDDYIEAGRAVQRFWLTATSLGLWQQPEMTPLIFNAYVRDGVAFSKDKGSLRRAHAIAGRLDHLLTPEISARAVWMGRLGTGPAPRARSIRTPLEDLLVNR